MPPYLGTTFDGTHTHYLTSRSTAIDAQDIEAMIKHITEHGYGIEITSQLLILANPLDVDASGMTAWRDGIEYRTGAPLPKFDFIATFSMPATPWLLGSSGLIAGGTLAILADATLAAAIGTSLPPQSGLVTSELSLRFLRPVRAGGDLVAHGTLVDVGRSLGLSHVRITDGSGRLLADGRSMRFIWSSSGSGKRDPGDGSTQAERWISR